MSCLNGNTTSTAYHPDTTITISPILPESHALQQEEKIMGFDYV